MRLTVWPTFLAVLLLFCMDGAWTGRAFCPVLFGDDALPPPRELTLERLLWRCAIQEPASVTIGKSTVVIADARSLRVLNLQTGESRWPVSQTDAGILLKEEIAQSDLTLPLAIQNQNGILWGNALWAGVLPGTFLETRLIPRQLVCIDLQAEGNVVWARTPDQLQSEPGWEIASPPVCVGSQLAVLLESRTDRSQCSLVLIDVNGAGVSRFPVSFSSDSQGQTHRHLNSDGDSLFFASTFDCFYWERTEQSWKQIALNSVEGNLENSSNSAIGLDSLVTPTHLLRLTGNKVTVWPRNQQDNSSPSPLRGEGGRRPDEGANVAGAGTSHLSNPSPRPSPLRGEGEFRDRLPGVVLSISPEISVSQLLSADSERVVLAGKGILSIRIDTGAEIWRWDPAVPGFQGTGRGTLWKEKILWPTAEELWLIDPDSGELEKRIPIRALTGISGGDLVLSSDVLFMQSGEQFSVWKIPAEPTTD